jgi:hypothetical protein
MGVDSILAVDLINQLNATLGIRLRGTDLFNLPNPRALCEYIVAHYPDVGAIEPAASAPAKPATPPPGSNGHDHQNRELLDMLRRLGTGHASVSEVEQLLGKP